MDRFLSVFALSLTTVTPVSLHVRVQVRTQADRDAEPPSPGSDSEVGQGSPLQGTQASPAESEDSPGRPQAAIMMAGRAAGRLPVAPTRSPTQSRP
eukprot:409745-Rhodomonas_salina.1